MTFYILLSYPGGRGGLPYKRDGDARRKCLIKPLKETNLGVAQAYLTPKRYHSKKDRQTRVIVTLIKLQSSPVMRPLTQYDDTLMAKNIGVPS